MDGIVLLCGRVPVDFEADVTDFLRVAWNVPLMATVLAAHALADGLDGVLVTLERPRRPAAR